MTMDRKTSDNNYDVVHRTAIRYPRTGDHPSGAAGFVRENASACVTTCFNELIPNVEDACRQLQQPESQQTRLWDLYCCDSISCGVYIGGIGLSPNVDLIINECQNIGFFSIEDPGPPPTNYCTFPIPNTITTSAVTYNQPTSTGSRGPYTVPPIHTFDTSMLVASTAISTSSPSNSGSPITANTTSPGLTKGAKAAISIFSVIAVLAIAGLVFFLARRRRSLGSSSPGTRPITYVNRPYPIPPSGPGTPLITPPPSASSRSFPLTPPAKLSERKYLDSGPKTEISRPPTSPGAANEVSPISPVGIPTQSRHTPRLERSQTTSIDRPPVIGTASIPPDPPQSSVYSLSSGPGGSTITVGSNKVSSVHSGSATVTGASTPALSATRFPRAHDGPLDSSDLVTPAGPPPNRALPPPPLNYPNSPTFSAASISPRSPTFPPRTFARGDSPVVPTQQVDASRPPTSISAKELRDLTESYARGTRESWGSWSGVGGGGPGVGPTGRKRGSAEKKGEAKTAVALQELDLEKLGGRY